MRKRGCGSFFSPLEQRSAYSSSIRAVALRRSILSFAVTVRRRLLLWTQPPAWQLEYRTQQLSGMLIMSMNIFTVPMTFIINVIHQIRCVISFTISMSIAISNACKCYKHGTTFSEANLLQQLERYYRPKTNCSYTTCKLKGHSVIVVYRYFNLLLPDHG